MMLGAAFRLAAAEVVLYPGTHLDVDIISLCLDTQRFNLNQITGAMVSASVDGRWRQADPVIVAGRASAREPSGS